MKLSRRHKLTIAALLVYWPTIFVLSHISPATTSRLLIPVRLPDKILHLIAYLLLTFLFWFTVSPYNKVRWHRTAVWWALLVVVWYGVLDEWLQGYVGRSPDVMDFFADLAGTLVGFVLLTVFSFWSAALVVTGTITFVLTNLGAAATAGPPPLGSSLLLFFLYGLFTLLWIRYMYHYRPTTPPQPRWLAEALALPAAYMAGAEISFFLTRGHPRPYELAISAIAITAVVAVCYLTALLRPGKRRRPCDDTAARSAGGEA